MSGGLPEGWAEVPLDQLCERQRGVSYPGGEASSEPRRGYLPVLRANNIVRDRLAFDDLVYVPAHRISEKQRIRGGDIVVAMSSGSKSVVGKSAQATCDWEGGFGAFCGVLRPLAGVDYRYLGLFLRTREYRNRISELAAGTNINNLKAGHFSKILVPLAPAAEQRRIVATLTDALRRQSASEEALSSTTAVLPRLRQSILASACSGRLTAGWRRMRGAPVESIAVQETNYEAPLSWGTARLDDLAKFIDYRGRTPQKVAKGIPLITAKNIRQGYIDREPREYIRTEDYDSWMTRGIPRVGDVLITTEAPLGYVAAVDITEKFALAQRTICLQFHDSRNQAFARLLMMSPAFQAMLTDQSTGTTVSGIKASRLKQLHLLLPPQPEQQEIVRRARVLLEIVERVETQVAVARRRTEELAQAILAKAFRGELVPTEAELAAAEGRDYESGDALLRRIRECT